MSSPRSRRAALRAGAIAVTALCVPALAVAMPAADLDADLDAELYALLDRWHEINAAVPRAVVAYDAASARARAAYPPMPAELFSGIGDRCIHLAARATGHEKTATGVRTFFYPGEVEKLRAGSPVTRWASTAEGEKARREPDPEGEARRLEIVGAYDRWSAERKAVEDAAGLTAANDAIEAQVQALNAAEDGVKLCPARSLPGLLRKAAWVADLLTRDAGDDDLALAFAREVASFGGVAA